MDRARLGRDLATSVRLPVTGERRLIAGALVGLVAYGLWVGATARTLAVLAREVSGLGLSTGPSVSGLVAVTFLWILGPATAWTYLVIAGVTDASGNLEQHYRVRYPSVLIGPPLAAFALAVWAGVALGAFPPPLLAALVALGVYVLVRTLAYSYRVFSLSMPRAVQAFVFESAAVLAVALVVGLATRAGNRGAVVDATRGVDALLGTTGLTRIVAGTVTVGGVSLPALSALAAIFPVALALTYIVVQTFAGLVVRLRGETVPRSHLRTGQRYPSFARPTPRRPAGMGRPVEGSGSTEGDASAVADRGAVAAGSSANGGAASASRDGTASAETADAGTESVGDGYPGLTRVFTPPDDTDFEWAPGGAVEGSGGAVSGGEPTRAGAGDGDTRPTSGRTGNATGASGGSEYTCPTCEETFAAGTSFAYCPTCGTELQPENSQ